MEFESSRAFLVRQFTVFLPGFPGPVLDHFYGCRVKQAGVSVSHASGSEPSTTERLTNLTFTQVLHTGHCSGSSGVTLEVATAAGFAAATGRSAASCSQTRFRTSPELLA